MSLKGMKHNSELVNAFNNFCVYKDEYMNVESKHKDEQYNLKNAQFIEIQKLAKQLISSIEILMNNESFDETASSAEKKEILKIKEDVKSRLTADEQI
jgi:hypothetical protein